MRQVKKRKKNAGGLLERTGAHIDTWLQQAVSTLITYISVFVAGLCVLALLMLFAGGYFFNIGERMASATENLTRLAGMEVSRVTLKGARNLEEREVLAALTSERFGPVMGRGILYVNIQQARHKVEGLGWVKHASVSRLWPGTVHISVEERIPAALWQRPRVGDLYLIDADGNKIIEVSGDAYAGLPVILGSEKPQDSVYILALLKNYPAMEGRLVALTRQGNRRWDLTFRNGFSALLPERGEAAALAKLAQMNAGEGPLGETVKKMDMRDPSLIRLQTEDGVERP